MQVALFYFAYYASVGIILGYLPSYFQSLGFSGKEIALAASLQPLLMIGVPPIWGFFADRTGKPVQLLRIASAGAFLAFIPMLRAGSVAAVTMVMGGFALCATTLASLVDSIAVVESRRIGTDFARLRACGSIGFVVATWGFAFWLDAGGEARHAPAWALAAMGGSVAAALAMRPTPPIHFAAPPSLREAGQLLRQPALLLFFAASMLHWAAMAPYHMLFAIHLRGMGASPLAVGAGFALAVLAEVVVMWRFRSLLQRLPLLPLLLVCYASGVVRWLVTGLVNDGLAVAIVQAFHGLTYGAFYVGAVVWLEREVPERLRATGRALYASLVFGIGGVFGNTACGALFDLGGARLAFLAAAGLDLLPPLLLLLALRHAAGVRPAAA